VYLLLVAACVIFLVVFSIRGIETLPVSGEWWPRPTEEIEAANGDRYYSGDTLITLTVEAIGIHDVPIVDSGSDGDLDQGVIHLPDTPMPWEEREQKNVYLAGHRLGWPGTGSRLVFYNLDKLKKGDTVVLRDSLGNPYEYRVSEAFVVTPEADWAVDPVKDRDMVTLQTCTFPDLVNRLIVRADRA
jgi:sortase A